MLFEGEGGESIIFQAEAYSGTLGPVKSIDFREFSGPNGCWAPAKKEKKISPPPGQIPEYAPAFKEIYTPEFYFYRGGVLALKQYLICWLLMGERYLFTHLVLTGILLLETLSVVLNNSSCKDDNALFTTVPFIVWSRMN